MITPRLAATSLSTALLFLLVSPNLAHAQARFNLRLAVASNDGTTAVLDAFASASAPTGAKLASSNLVFDYDPRSYSNPVYVPGSSALGPTVPVPGYTVTVTEPQIGRASINIVQTFDDYGTNFTTTPVLIAKIQLTVTAGGGGTPDINWLEDRTRATVVFQDDAGTRAPGTSGTTQLMSGMLTGLSSVPLPVELTGFRGAYREVAGRPAVDLAWETAAERGSAYFDVEHSVDGERFVAFAQLAAMGEASVVSGYDAVHSSPARGVNYYRLRQVDLDGAEAYSAVVAVEVPGIGGVGETSLEVWPNPVRTTLNVRIAGLTEAGELRLWDVQGRLVGKWPSEETMVLEVGVLPKGVYSLELVGVDGRGQRARVVKQ